MKRRLELRQERAHLLDDAKAIMNKARDEKRDMNTQEKRKFDDLMDKVGTLHLEIEIAEEQEQEERDRFAGAAGASSSGNRGGPRISRDSQTINPPTFAITPSGESVRLLTPAESLRSITPNTLPDNARLSEFSLGRAIRGLATGSWKGAELERRALDSGSGTAGGFLLEPIISADLLDLARNKSVVFQAGARTLPMETAEVIIARLTGDPTPTWKAENVALTEANITFGQFVLKAKTLAVLVASSLELIEDAANLTDVVRNSLSQAIALELDRAVLRGSGAPLEINGLMNWRTGSPAINYIDLGTNGAALSSFDKFSEAVQKILEKNGQPNVVVYAPRTWGAIDVLKEATTNAPLAPPASFAGLTKIVSTQIPVNLVHGSANDASEAYVGDGTTLLVGMRTSLNLEVSREAGDAFKKGQVYLRAYIRADAIPTRPDHWTLIDGIIP